MDRSLPDPQSNSAHSDSLSDAFSKPSDLSLVVSALAEGEIKKACDRLEITPAFSKEFIDALLNALSDYSDEGNFEFEDDNGYSKTAYQQRLEELRYDRDLIVGALAMVAEELPESAAPAFKHRLTADNKSDTIAILDVLARAPLTAAALTEELFDLLDSHDNERIQIKAVSVLGISRGESEPILRGLLMRCVKWEKFEGDVAASILECAADVANRDPQQNGTVAIEFLDHDHHLVRAAAAYALALMRFTDINANTLLIKAASQLFRMLDSDSSDERAQAAHGIYYLRVRDLFPKLCRPEPSNVQDFQRSGWFRNASSSLMHEAFTACQHIFYSDFAQLRESTLERLQLIKSDAEAAVEELTKRFEELCEVVDSDPEGEKPNTEWNSDVYDHDEHENNNLNPADMERVSLCEMLSFLCECRPDLMLNPVSSWIKSERAELRLTGLHLVGSLGTAAKAVIPDLLESIARDGRPLLLTDWGALAFASRSMPEQFTWLLHLAEISDAPVNASRWDYSFGPIRPALTHAICADLATNFPVSQQLFVESQEASRSRMLLLVIGDCAMQNYGKVAYDRLFVEKLEHVLCSSRDPFEKIHALRALGAGGESSASALSTMVEMLDAEVSAVKVAAARAIGLMGRHGLPALGKVVEMFDEFPLLDLNYFDMHDSRNTAPRNAAISTDTVRPGESVSEGEYEFVTSAILSMVRSSKDGPTLLEQEIITTPSAACRAGALRAYTQLLETEPSCRSNCSLRSDDLVQYLNSGYEYVRAYAVLALGFLGASSRPCLNEMIEMALKDPSQFVRTKCHEAAARIAPDQQNVFELLKDSLAQYRRFGYMPQDDLDTFIARFKAHPVGIFSGLASCAEHFPQVLGLFSEAIRNSGDDMRLSAIKGLAHLKDFEAAKELLEEGIRLGDQMSRQVGVSALAHFGAVARSAVLSHATNECDEICKGWAQVILAKLDHGRSIEQMWY